MTGRCFYEASENMERAANALAGEARNADEDKQRIKDALMHLHVDHGAAATLALLSGQLVSLVESIAKVQGEDPNKKIVLEASGFRTVTIHAMGDSK